MFGTGVLGRLGSGPRGWEASVSTGHGGRRPSCTVPGLHLRPLQTLSPSSELRILLLCGSDLLESFCIPGLWNEADVSSEVMTLYTAGMGKGARGHSLWASGLPSSHSPPPQPRAPRRTAHSHLQGTPSSSSYCLLTLFLTLAPGKPMGKKQSEPLEYLLQVVLGVGGDGGMPVAGGGGEG